jgi:hypothetical protein
MNDEQIRERIGALLESQPLAVLATATDEQPH